MKSIDRIVRRIIFLCALLLLGPEALVLVKHIVRDVASQPAGARTGTAPGGGGFEAGVLTGLVVLVLLAGLLSRLRSFLRHRDPHRETRDRRARTMPRVRAEGVPPHGGDRVVIDDDPLLE